MGHGREGWGRGTRGKGRERKWRESNKRKRGREGGRGEREGALARGQGHRQKF